MLLILDNWRVLVAKGLFSPDAYLNNSGSMWQSNPSSSRSEFTSACFCFNSSRTKFNYSKLINKLNKLYFAYSIISLFFFQVGQTPAEERGPKHKEEVGENGTQQRVLHNVDFVLAKSK